MKKVFISSTSSDLENYRTSAIAACLKLGFFPIAMEHFPAEDEDPSDYCRKRVAEADIYLGIFGHRYGFIPKGETRSMTHIEYDEATKLGIPRLCFLVDKDYAWSPTQIEFDKKAELDAFKASIDAVMVRQSFTTVHDLEAKILHSLSALGNSTSSTKQTAQTRFNTNVPAMRVLGREADIKLIREMFINASPQSRPHIVVRGFPGVGKTTIASALAQDEASQKRFPDGIFRMQVGESPDVMKLLKELAKNIGLENIPLHTDDFLSELSRFLRQKSFLIIVDDLWQMESSLEILNALKECACVITTRFLDLATNLVQDSQEQVYYLAELKPEGAMQLLQAVSPKFVSEMPNEANELIEEIERLPLALIVAGRLIEQSLQFGRAEVANILADIRNGAILQKKAPPDRYEKELGTIPTVEYLLEQSVKYLNQEERFAFMSLGGLAPKPALFQLEIFEEVWESENTIEIAKRLLGFGLLEFLPEINRYQMHALIVMYAKKLLWGN